MKQQIKYNLNQLSDVAKKLAIKLQGFKVITFTGELGAGKTTLIKKLLKEWGVQDEVVSPTYTYLNCYKNKAGQKFFHFDLYRIKDINEFFLHGFDEYLEHPNGICLIEWPQVIDQVLQNNNKVCRISISHSDLDRRELSIK